MAYTDYTGPIFIADRDSRDNGYDGHQLGKLIDSGFAGGFGQYFVTRDEGTGKTYGVKVYKDSPYPSSLTHDDIVCGRQFSGKLGEDIEQVRKEYAKLKELNALQDVPGASTPLVYSLGYAEYANFNRFPALLMEHIEGKTLEEAIGSGWLSGDVGTLASFETVITVAKNIVAAYKCIHRHGVFHRDASSKNILVSANGHISVIDFGNSAHFGSRVTFGRFADCQFGAPEVFKNHDPSRFSAEQDIWSIGALISFIRSGMPPHDPARIIGASPEDLYRLKSRSVDLTVALAKAARKGKKNAEFGAGDRELTDIVGNCTVLNPKKRLSLDEVDARLDEALKIHKEERAREALKHQTFSMRFEKGLSKIRYAIATDVQTGAIIGVEARTGKSLRWQKHADRRLPFGNRKAHGIHNLGSVDYSHMKRPPMKREEIEPEFLARRIIRRGRRMDVALLLGSVALSTVLVFALGLAFTKPVNAWWSTFFDNDFARLATVATFILALLMVCLFALFLLGALCPWACSCIARRYGEKRKKGKGPRWKWWAERCSWIALYGFANAHVSLDLAIKYLHGRYDETDSFCLSDDFFHNLYIDEKGDIQFRESGKSTSASSSSKQDKGHGFPSLRSMLMACALLKVTIERARTSKRLNSIDSAALHVATILLAVIEGSGKENREAVGRIEEAIAGLRALSDAGADIPEWIDPSYWIALANGYLLCGSIVFEKDNLTTYNYGEVSLREMAAA